MTVSSSLEGNVARRFAAVFPDQSIVLVDRADRMATRFDTLAHQRPATCGAYVLSYLLAPLGFERHDGKDLTAEDYLAHLAGVIIEEYEVAPSEEVARQVAGGVLSETQALERYPHSWYRYPVRHSLDPAMSGTSPTGVARAIAVGTSGQLGSLPISARIGDAVQLTPERWAALLELLAAHVDAWRWHVVLNYESDLLLRPNDPAFTPGNLRLPNPETVIPHDDWHVGHFVGVAGLWRMDDGPWWLLLFDTYKERGFDGYQPQPAELMRRGLVRSDGRGGGLLVVVPRDAIDEAAAAIEGIGLCLTIWSNGSTEPDDWAWERGR